MLRGQFVAVFILGASFAATVEARDVDCTGNLGAVELAGNLNVAGRCRLAGTDVKGKVVLFAGGSLVARNARIRGNVEAKRADFVDVDKTVIEGNVRLDELVGDSSTMSGEHRKHIGKGLGCEECHATTVAAANEIVAPNQHVDGTKQTSFPSGMVFTAGSCTGTCHGEGHDGRNW